MTLPTHANDTAATVKYIHVLLIQKKYDDTYCSNNNDSDDDDDDDDHYDHDYVPVYRSHIDVTITKYDFRND